MRANSKRDKGTEEWKGGTERQEVRRGKKVISRMKKDRKQRETKKGGRIAGRGGSNTEKEQKEGQVREDGMEGKKKRGVGQAKREIGR